MLEGRESIVPTRSGTKGTVHSMKEMEVHAAAAVTALRYVGDKSHSSESSPCYGFGSWTCLFLWHKNFFVGFAASGSTVQALGRWKEGVLGMHGICSDGYQGLPASLPGYTKILQE
jgi:hypothetical protein